MVEIIILYILNKHDVSIYRLKKMIDDYFFGFANPSLGTIQPALKRLEKMGCLGFIENMSEGGMKTKTCLITPAGKSHLIHLLLNWENKNVRNVLTEVKILLCCCDVLSINEMLEFKENIRNYLELYKIKLEKGLNNNLVSLNEIQRNTLKITLNDTNEIIKLL